jgi:hypothetical protein
MYTTVAGSLPNLVDKGEAKTFVPYEDLLKFKEEIVKAYSRPGHTAYENACWVSFLLTKAGLK